MISREGKHEIAFRVCNSLFKITAVFNNNVRSQGHVCCRDHQQKVHAYLNLYPKFTSTHEVVRIQNTYIR